MRLKTWYVLALVVLGITSCRKYEEGPNISLRSKEARITNNWRIESVIVNGVERSAEPYWAKQKHYMYKDGNYIVTIIDPVTLEARNISGDWKLFDNDKKIALNLKNFSGNVDSVAEYNILKLFNKQFWIRKTDNTSEIHFTPAD